MHTDAPGPPARYSEVLPGCGTQNEPHNYDVTSSNYRIRARKVGSLSTHKNHVKLKKIPQNWTS